MVLFFSCLALIEYETCLLYKAIVDKTEDLRVRLLLFNILAETKKHKGVLEQMSKIYGQTYPPQMADCNKMMGKVFKESVESARSLRRKSRKGLPLLQVMENLVDYEKAIGEEYATIIYSQLKILQTREAAMKKILEYIVMDEERHVEALRLAIRIEKGRRKQRSSTAISESKARNGYADAVV
jgi:rubrerythrin